MRIFYRLKRHSRTILLILLRDTAQTLLSQRMRAINSTNWILKNHCERTTACYSDGSTGKTEWVTFLGCRLNRYLTGPSSSSGGGNNNTNDQRQRIRRQRLVIHSLHWHHGAVAVATNDDGDDDDCDDCDDCFCLARLALGAGTFE